MKTDDFVLIHSSSIFCYRVFELKPNRSNASAIPPTQSQVFLYITKSTLCLRANRSQEVETWGINLTDSYQTVKAMPNKYRFRFFLSVGLSFTELLSFTLFYNTRLECLEKFLFVTDTFPNK